MKIKVTVTKADIARGMQQVGTLCPIAKALSRKGYNAGAYGDRIDLICQKTGKRYVAATPKAAYHFMIGFDKDRKAVKPIAFQIQAKEYRV